ncbi:MAG: hypothetical protein JW746_10720 [Candidatus Krumholzibacteriota bacterium]|nr:hypothetical protein [Candidatus Krumholzibacteriota bacterium]
MTQPGQKEKNSEASEFYSGEISESKRKLYSVIIDGVASEIETLESFAIKFGLLSNIPVTKVKYLVSHIPSEIWSGPSRSRAKGLLSLIVEAGGKGRIEEKRPRKVKPSAIEGPKMKRLEGRKCLKCGFPLGEGDEFCQFCMTPIGDLQKKEHHGKKRSRKFLIPPARLLFYMFFLLAGLIIMRVAR